MTRRSGFAFAFATRAGVNAALLITTAYFLLPIYWLVVASSKSRADLVTTFGLWFSDFNLFQNLTDLFAEQRGIYGRWLVNSLIYSGVSAVVATALAALCGYALAVYQFRGRGALFGIVLGSVLVPVTALALPTFLLFAKIGITDTYWAVLLPSILSPFGVYLIRVFVEAAVPKELIEAGRVDGASEFTIFRSLVLKIISPALVTVFLFQFVGVWNNFFLPLIMLQSDDLYPVTLGLFSWQSQITRDPQLLRLIIVGSLVSVIPLVATFLGFQRYWRAGLAAGAIKG